MVLWSDAMIVCTARRIRTGAEDRSYAQKYKMVCSGLPGAITLKSYAKSDLMLILLVYGQLKTVPTLSQWLKRFDELGACLALSNFLYHLVVGLFSTNNVPKWYCILSHVPLLIKS